jgi:hypothetical protein
MFIPGNFHERRSIARSYFLLFAVPGCRRDAVTHDITTFLGGSFAPSDPASLSSQPTRSKPLSIAAPPQALGLGDTCATSLCLRAGRSATMGAATRLARLCSDLAAAVGPRLGSGKAPALATCATSLCLRAGRSATMGAATRLARLCSDLAAAAGPRLGSGKAPALAKARRCLVRCQSHVPVLPVRPHDARARAHTSCIVVFDRSPSQLPLLAWAKSMLRSAVNVAYSGRMLSGSNELMRRRHCCRGRRNC